MSDAHLTSNECSKCHGEKAIDNGRYVQTCDYCDGSGKDPGAAMPQHVLDKWLSMASADQLREYIREYLAAAAIERAADEPPACICRMVGAGDGETRVVDPRCRAHEPIGRSAPPPTDHLGYAIAALRECDDRGCADCRAAWLFIRAGKPVTKEGSLIGQERGERIAKAVDEARAGHETSAAIEPPRCRRCLGFLRPALMGGLICGSCGESH